MFGLLGSNGAGKTTAIKMLTTLLPPTSGTATVAGFDICRDASRVRMSASLECLVAPLHAVEAVLARDVEEQQQRWRYRVQAGRIWFDEQVRLAHARLRQSIPAYIREGSLLSLATAPVIYSLIVPLAVLDVWVFAYQWVCFPIYGIARVPRGSYFVFDRHKLAYLNGIEKISCTFCSYANGLIAYEREVAARTEQYRCPISMHTAGRTARALPSLLRLR